MSEIKDFAHPATPTSKVKKCCKCFLTIILRGWHTKLHNLSIYKYKMYNNSSNWPCRNHIITVLGKSEVYSAKLTSLFGWILVCKNINTVIYKIKMASECFTNQP